MTCQEHGTPGQRLTATDLIASNELLLGVFAQRDQQIIELAVKLIESSEVGHDALGGAAIDSIGFDDLQVLVGLASAFDCGDARERARGLPTLGRGNVLLSLLTSQVCTIPSLSQGKNRRYAEHVVTTPGPSERPKPPSHPQERQFHPGTTPQTDKHGIGATDLQAGSLLY